MNVCRHFKALLTNLIHERNNLKDKLILSEIISVLEDSDVVLAGRGTECEPAWHQVTLYVCAQDWCFYERTNKPGFIRVFSGLLGGYYDIYM